MAQLLHGPLRCGMSRDAKLENAPPVVCQHQEHVEHLKPERRHGEKVDGNHALHMVVQEGSPRLGRRLAPPYHVFGDGRLGNLDPEFEQFAMNTRSTPPRIVTTDHSNQITDFLRHSGTAALAAPDLPSPKETKAFPMPGDDRGWYDDQQGGFPVRPNTTQPHPENSIRGRQS